MYIVFSLANVIHNHNLQLNVFKLLEDIYNIQHTDI